MDSGIRTFEAKVGQSAFGRTVSGLLGQKSESRCLKVGTNPAPTRHFQEVGSRAKRSDRLPFLVSKLVS